MKTITVRIDDDMYKILKKAADGERRTISNFVENASLVYLTNEIYVSDYEMNEILNDAKLVSGIRKGMDDARKGKEIIESFEEKSKNKKPQFVTFDELMK